MRKANEHLFLGERMNYLGVKEIHAEEFRSLPLTLKWFVSLFIFYILSYLLSKTMGCFSGHLMSSASGQKLFCEVCSAFKCSFDEFVGEKVVSPSYSSAILAPSLKWFGVFKIHTCVCLIMTNSLRPF